jgi:hypothetical protein
MSSSKSNSSQASSSTDNRRVIGENGISAENSSVNVWNSTLDGEVVNRALSSVDSVTGNAFNFGSDALGFGSDALNFGKSALTTAGNTFSDSLGFAEAISKAKDTLMGNVFSDSLGFAEGQSKQFATLSSNALSDALASNDSAIKQMLSYGTKATTQVLDNAADTTALVADAYAEAKGRGALTDKLIMGAIAAMALIAFMAVKK